MSNAWLGGESQDTGSGQRETRWLTPAPIVAALGDFDLDPCRAPGHVLAKRTLLLEDGADGLVDEWGPAWSTRVWLNPPYGKQTEPFLRRLADHGRGTALIFARTETSMFFEQVWARAHGILFLRGRISFLDSEGVKAKANAGAPSCLVAYGEEDMARLMLSGLKGHIVHLTPTHKPDTNAV